MPLDLATLSRVLSSNIGQNTGRDYLTFLTVFVVLIILLRIFKIYIVHYLKKLSKKTKNELDDVLIDFVSKIKWSFYIFISLYIASKIIVLPAVLHKILEYITVILIVYYAVKGLSRIVDYFVSLQVDKRHAEDKKEDTSLIVVLGKIIKGIVWVIAILLILSNTGINITSLVAGLGIGGIAIAFALQSILQDLFSSFSIYFDKPFKIGDFIIVGQDMGVVKHIGIKSTRIQALQGQEIVISNKELTSERINNYKRMEKRRVVFGFGVEYSTSLQKLKKINKIVEGIFKKVEKADLDRVHFKAFGDFSLNYEVVYYVGTREYNEYMDIQQKINFALKEEFEKAKIEFAFPTQTLHVKK